MEPSLEPCTPGRVVTGRAFPSTQILRAVTSGSLSCRSGAADTHRADVLSAAVADGLTVVFTVVLLSRVMLDRVGSRAEHLTYLCQGRTRDGHIAD